jgi:hypothetical protein
MGLEKISDDDKVPIVCKGPCVWWGGGGGTNQNTKFGVGS